MSERGWAKVMTSRGWSRKFHFFDFEADNGRSHCGRYLLLGHPELDGDTGTLGVFDCKACADELAKRKVKAGDDEQ